MVAGLANGQGQRLARTVRSLHRQGVEEGRNGRFLGSLEALAGDGEPIPLALLAERRVRAARPEPAEPAPASPADRDVAAFQPTGSKSDRRGRQEGFAADKHLRTNWDDITDPGCM